MRTFVALLAPALLAAGPPRDDHQKIQGTWICTRLNIGGHWGKATVKGGGDERITFEGDRFANTTGHVSSGKGVFKLVPAKKGKALDLVYDADAGKGLSAATVPCIYELEDDKLKICYGFEGRPARFASNDDSDNVIMIYKRARPKR
jgi:uncharacterized protein (TIGR03067 family)